MGNIYIDVQSSMNIEQLKILLQQLSLQSQTLQVWKELKKPLEIALDKHLNVHLPTKHNNPSQCFVCVTSRNYVSFVLLLPCLHSCYAPNDIQ